MRTKYRRLDQADSRLLRAVDVLADNFLFRAQANYFSPFASALNAHILTGRQLEFLAYWGIGAKECPGAEEETSIQFHRTCLGTLASAAGLPWALEFIFTDTHAEVNQKPTDLTEKYIAAMEPIVQVAGFKSVRMTTLLQSAGLYEYWRYARANALSNPLWQSLRIERRRELLRLAERHSSGGDKEAAAAEYFVSNLVEGAALMMLSPCGFFVTFMLPSMSYLLPPIPKIHIFSGPGRATERPWFMG